MSGSHFPPTTANHLPVLSQTRHRLLMPFKRPLADKDEDDASGLPRDHVLIFLDDKGIPRVKQSPSIQGDFFTPSVQNWFLKCLQYQKPRIENNNFQDYYEKALINLQQIDCRTIAKAFIRLIEPRKQVTHPYNGRPAGASRDHPSDPNTTKPGWWPAGVTHKEPDHLPKKERIELLIHIIRNNGKIGKNCATLDELEQAAINCRNRLENPQSIKILSQIFEARRMEEEYEKSQIAGSATSTGPCQYEGYFSTRETAAFSNALPNYYTTSDCLYPVWSDIQFHGTSYQGPDYNGLQGPYST